MTADEKFNMAMETYDRRDPEDHHCDEDGHVWRWVHSDANGTTRRCAKCDRKEEVG